VYMAASLTSKLQTAMPNV